MIRFACALLWSVVASGLHAQSYTNWFTGDTANSPAQPMGGVCMMGGATEFDPAMQWFLDRANGGDVLVLRASGSNGYNDYMYSTLGGVNSVETILFNNANAAYDPYVAQRIQRAEAIWFAGGDQWNYVGYWRNTPVQTLINEAIAGRNIAIGGTSAGMAILGGCYFSAEYGSITSAFALAHPTDQEVAVDCTPFLNVPYMAGTITDTHYDNPDRRGRQFTFLARMVELGVSTAYGIACNEYVAVCISPDGIAHVYGEYPDYQEFAFFLRVHCEPPVNPELCVAGMPLTWDRGDMAVKVYKVPGLPNGNNWFDLNDHLAGSGGAWENWSAVAGSFNALPGTAPDCLPTTVADQAGDHLRLEWNPAQGSALLLGVGPSPVVQLFTADGREVSVRCAPGKGGCTVLFPENARGLLLLRVAGMAETRVWKLERP